MPKVGELSEAERVIVTNLNKKGLSNRKIAAQLEIHHSTVAKILKKHKTYGFVTNLPREGRKRITDEKTDRRILREITNGKKTTIKEIKESLQLDISSTTIRRRLHEEGYWGRVAKRVPCISKKNMNARIKFATNYINMPNEFWNKIIWSDESKFECFGSNRRQTV